MKFNEIIQTLGLNPDDYAQWSKKSDTFLMHQLRRKIRYNCFAIQRGDVENTPEEFIAYFEQQDHFSGWELFADRWDVTKEDPSKTYPRVHSIADEWEAELRMCLPEIPGAIAYKQGS